MKTTVIHHSADFDGLFCREIARKFLPDAELIGWDFGDATLPPELPIRDQVYVLDLPLDRPFGLSGSTAIVKSVHSKTIWIDHHKSSIESHPTDIMGYRIDGVAACRLAWQWFTMVDGNTKEGYVGHGCPMIRPAGVLPMIQDYKNREVNEPLAVRLAGEYDVWDHRDPRAELFQFGLRSTPLTDGVWDNLLDPKYLKNIVEQLLERGEPIAYAREQEYRDVITQQGFDVEFEGLKFLACNSHECDIRSQLFEAGIKPHHDGLIGFTFGGNDWRVSLYGVPGKPDIDLSPIAKKYGGGGHRQACGFRAKTLPFLK